MLFWCSIDVIKSSTLSIDDRPRRKLAIAFGSTSLCSKYHWRRVNTILSITFPTQLARAMGRYDAKSNRDLELLSKCAWRLTFHSQGINPWRQESLYLQKYTAGFLAKVSKCLVCDSIGCCDAWTCHSELGRYFFNLTMRCDERLHCCAHFSRTCQSNNHFTSASMTVGTEETASVGLDSACTPEHWQHEPNKLHEKFIEVGSLNWKDHKSANNS